jgi:hypothetical protein
MKEERKEPNASEANSGTVIIYLLKATSVLNLGALRSIISEPGKLDDQCSS